MRLLTFAKRNTTEILRDPLHLCFGLGFPLVLIGLLSAIQANIPTPLFEIERLAPGVTVFGLANDAIGYIVPDNDYSMGLVFDHYQEILSLSQETASRIMNGFAALAEDVR